MAPRRKPDGGGRAPAGPPPLLARLYGDGNVLCLRELLLRLGGASREAAALPAALVQPHDHADYSQVLLAIVGSLLVAACSTLMQHLMEMGCASLASATTAWCALKPPLTSPTAAAVGTHVVCAASWGTGAEGWVLTIPSRQSAAGEQGLVTLAAGQPAGHVDVRWDPCCICGLHFRTVQHTDPCVHVSLSGLPSMAELHPVQ